MCGICGRLDYDLRQPYAPQDIRAWCRTLRRRGPDEDGVFTRPGVALAMRRLSIIDLAGGSQPLTNERGTVQVVGNGEIYNYRELRHRLEARGHRFRSGSDIEVVAHLWEDEGADAVHHLRGMFALALWDETRRTLWLARDRIGIKPLYYAERSDGLDFASEMKALLALPETDRALDTGSLPVYFTVGYIPPPETMFRAIRELPPGHSLEWRPGSGPTIRPYWRLEFHQAPTPSGGWLEALDAAVDDAVRSHLVADVPVAAFLSGGLDSATVVAYMARAHQAPRAFTVRYRGTGSAATDETPLATRVAERYHADHTIIDVAPTVADILDDIVDAFDQPFADESTVPTYYLTKAVAAEVKVALSGLGGDELFGGYERHLALRWSAVSDRAPRWATAAVARLVSAAAPLSGGGLREDRLVRLARSLAQAPACRYLGFITRLPPAEVAALLAGADREDVDQAVTRLTRHFGGPGEGTLLDRGLAMDYGQYLPGDILPLTDRLSMWHSLEVRVPFVDHNLVELVAGLPTELKVRGTAKKVALRQLMQDRLPPDFFRAPKRGFVGPTADWLRTELRDMLHDALSPASLTACPFLDPRAVAGLLDAHDRSRSDRYAPPLWALLMFVRWHSRYVEHAAAPLAV